MPGEVFVIRGRPILRFAAVIVVAAAAFVGLDRASVLVASPVVDPEAGIEVVPAPHGGDARIAFTLRNDGATSMRLGEATISPIHEVVVATLDDGRPLAGTTIGAGDNARVALTVRTECRRNAHPIVVSIEADTPARLRRTFDVLGVEAGDQTAYTAFWDRPTVSIPICAT